MTHLEHTVNPLQCRRRHLASQCISRCARCKSHGDIAPVQVPQQASCAGHELRLLPPASRLEHQQKHWLCRPRATPDSWLFRTRLQRSSPLFQLFLALLEQLLSRGVLDAKEVDSRLPGINGLAPRGDFADFRRQDLAVRGQHCSGHLQHQGLCSSRRVIRARTPPS